MEYGACTHRGKVRKCNEDYYYIPDNGNNTNLIMVADGMGGHNAGDLASRMVVDEILQFHANTKCSSLDEVRDVVHQSIQKANSKVYEFSKTDEKYSGMGTTLTLVYFYENNACVGHVGDSRSYLIRHGGVIQITKDHSLVQELLENGTITQEEICLHPQKNVITRAMGTEEFVKTDYYEIKLMDNDILLLCTDGLINHVDLKTQQDIFENTKSLDVICKTLLEKALEAGGTDNITLVMARYSGHGEKR